jgi:steroid 5-alpha reductase family enzyme
MTKKTNHLIQITIMYIVMALSGYASWEYVPIDDVPLRYLTAHVVMTIICFIFSVLKKNSSVYDAFWSVIPFYFVVFWAYEYSDALNLPQWIAIAVVSIWSWRLTLNWARSWADFSHEDWRYVKLAKDTGAFYPAVNFLGIHLFPTLLVFGGMWPLLYLFLNPMDVEFQWLVYLGAAISILGIALEYFADNQLYAFRNKPNAKTGEILDTGLWGRMRYPNYLGEMLFWIGAMVMSFPFNPPFYTAFGAVAMCVLFLFISIPMKEKRMLERRNNYTEYQKRVPLLIPRFWK